MHERVRAERAVGDHGVGAHVRTVAERNFALQHHAYVDEHIGTHDELAAHVEALGVRERHAAGHEVRGNAAL